MKDLSVTDSITDNIRLILLYLTVLLAHICFKSRNFSHWEQDSVSHLPTLKMRKKLIVLTPKSV